MKNGVAPVYSESQGGSEGQNDGKMEAYHSHATSGIATSKRQRRDSTCLVTPIMDNAFCDTFFHVALKDLRITKEDSAWLLIG